MKALIVILAITTVFALILLIPVKFKVAFSYDDDGISNDISLKYGFIKIIPGKKKEKSNNAGENKKKESGMLKLLPKFIAGNIREIKDFAVVVLKQLLTKTVCVDRLYIKSELGFDDVMETGLIYGGVSGFIYNIAGLMDRKMKLKRHDISVKPDFNVPHIMAEAEAVISTNILNAIILAVIVLVRAYPLYKKLKTMIGENNDGKSD